MTNSKRISMSRIAEVAGVSCGLVSSFFAGKTYRAHGGSIGVSPETEEKIVEAARKLGYMPKDLTMRLRIYPDFGCFGFLNSAESRAGFSPFYSELMLGAYDRIGSNNVNFSLGTFNETVDYLSDHARLPFCATDDHTSKFMLAGTINYSLLLALRQRGCSIVYFLREVHCDGVISLVPDFEDAGYQGVRHLLEMGHRRIAVAGEKYFSNLSVNTDHMIRGITRAFAEYGLEFNRRTIVFNRQDEYNDCYEQLRDRNEQFTAVFCLCDYTALRMMKEVARAGLRIPEDVSFVGCNNQNFSANLNPALTSIDLNLYEIGKSAVDILNHPEKKHNSFYGFPIRLVKRQSVKNLNEQ